MASDSIKCQCRRICFLSADFTVRYKTKLDQSLESVTDTKCQTVSFIDQLHNSFFDLRILECSCKEFRRTIRFVTCGESAREHDDLCLIDCFLKKLYRVMDIFSSQVLEYFYIHLCTCTLECTCAVILAVCSREYRNKYTRFCNFVLAYIDAVCMIKLLISVSCLFIILRRNCLKYFFQSTFPCIFSFVYSDHCISIGEVTVSSYFTDHCISDGKLSNLTIRNFQDNITKSRCKEISRIKVMLDLHAHAITKCHLCNCSCNTMAVKCISRNNFAVLHIFMKFFILIHDSCIIRQIILILRCAKPYQFVSCFL